MNAALHRSCAPSSSVQLVRDHICRDVSLSDNSLDHFGLLCEFCCVRRNLPFWPLTFEAVLVNLH